MREVDFLIVGQGIAGTLISYELLKAGKSVMVIDKPGITNASYVAGAVINPFNINSWELSSKSRLFIPDALITYRQLEKKIGQSFLEEKPMFLFSPGKYTGPPVENEHIYMLSNEEQRYADRCFYPTALLLKLNVWQVQTEKLLNAWRLLLQNQDRLLQHHFDKNALQIAKDSITYDNIKYKAIIFCEGAAVDKNPFFSGLPFTKNRGEVLLVEIPGLRSSFVYHHKIRLIPTDKEDLFWCGSTYTWRFNDLRPSESWRKDTLAYLQSWLRLPVTVKDHIVAERPTTGGQEPMVGEHPAHPGVYIFNGLGTKGFSMGPFLATQLCRLLVEPNNTLPLQLVRPLATWI